MKIKQFDGLVDELRFGTRLLFQELGDPWGHIAVRLPKTTAVTDSCSSTFG